MPGRLMVGRLVLAQLIVVRIHARQQQCMFRRNARVETAPQMRAQGFKVPRIKNFPALLWLEFNLFFAQIEVRLLSVTSSHKYDLIANLFYLLPSAKSVKRQFINL